MLGGDSARVSPKFARRLPTFVTVMGAPCRLPISVRLLAKQSSIMDIWDGGKKDKSSGKEVQGDPSARQKPSVDLVPTVPAAGGPLL